MTSDLPSTVASAFPQARIDDDPVLARISRLHPQILVRGKGCHVWDGAGNRYIDCHLAWGSVILGHAHPRVVRAIRAQAKLGTTIGGTSSIAPDLYELVRRMVPGAGVLRFGKNGSDATLGAIRAARAHTGRQRVARCGYHGFHDWSLAGEGQPGVPRALDDHIVPFAFNNVRSLRDVVARHGPELAAIIIDPCVEEIASEPFLRCARQAADQHGAVLIFDEIISGFRIAKGGIQEIHGILPDLVCLGKSIANGMPLSIVTGRPALMQEFSRIWYGLTFEQETISMAAARACLDTIAREDVPASIGRKGAYLRERYADAARRLGIPTTLAGPPQRLIPRFRDSAEFGPAAMQNLRFVEALMEQRIILANALYLSHAHGDGVLEVLAAALRAALARVAADRPAAESIPAHFRLRAEIRPHSQALTGPADRPLALDCSVTNRGPTAWRCTPGDAGHVTFGIRLLSRDGALLDRDYFRVSLATAPLAAMSTGETVTLSLAIPAPAEPGDYCLELDAVAEGVCWFRDVGSQSQLVKVTVTP